MKICLDENAIMPTRAHDTDAGLDLYAREDKVVPAGGSVTFDTGVHIQLEGYNYPKSMIVDRVSGKIEALKMGIMYTAGFLKSKSGLMVNHDITSDGTIDFSYRGSIVVKLFNHGTEDYHVRRGDKISQLVIVPVLTPTLDVVTELDETERGENGFGSSGR